jgi:hypothetical protein
MAEKKSKELNVRVKDTEQFYSNEIGINVNPNEFTFDFKCLSRFQDIAEHDVLMVRHNLIILSPNHAKSMYDLLGQVLKNYEKNFGKINKTKAQEKAEKLIKKGTKKKKDKKTVAKKEPAHNYMG